jgi:hypothetical protein
MKKLLSLLIALSLCSFLNASDMHPFTITDDDGRVHRNDSLWYASSQLKEDPTNEYKNDLYQVELSLHDRLLWHNNPQEHAKLVKENLKRLAREKQDGTDSERSSGTTTPVQKNIDSTGFFSATDFSDSENPEQFDQFAKFLRKTEYIDSFTIIHDDGRVLCNNRLLHASLQLKKNPTEDNKDLYQVELSLHDGLSWHNDPEEHAKLVEESLKRLAREKQDETDSEKSSGTTTPVQKTNTAASECDLDAKLPITNAINNIKESIENREQNFSVHFITRISYINLSEIEEKADIFGGTITNGPMMFYGYTLDRELSTDEVKIFYNDSQQRLVITYRGTQISKSNGKDIYTDVLLAIGSLEKADRYQDNLERTQRAMSKYENYDTWLFGHSLGGSIASKIGITIPDCNVVTYNKGSGVGGIWSQKSTNPKEIAYRAKGDIASLAARLDANVKTRKPSREDMSRINLHEDRWDTREIPFFR